MAVSEQANKGMNMESEKEMLLEDNTGNGLMTLGWEEIFLHRHKKH